MDECRSATQLETTLYGLLFNHEARKQFLDAVEAPDPDLPDFLMTIDRSELNSVTRKIARNLLYGNSLSLGGLSASFSKSLEQIAAADHEALVSDFMASDAFALATDIRPIDRPNCCIEEAFYLFLKTHPLYQSPQLQALIKFEVYKSVLSIYVHNSTPCFVPLELDIRKHANTHYSLVLFDYEFVRAMFPTKVIAQGSPISVLFAATSRGLLLGPLSDPSRLESYLS